MTTRNRRLPGNVRALGGMVSALVLFLGWLTPDFEIEAQEPGPVTEEARIWVEVTDGKGRVPPSLSVEELEVTDGGQAVEVVGLEAGALDRRAGSESPARWVLYFDTTLSSSGTLRRGAQALSERASELTEIGDVEVVMADPSPEADISTRDSLALAERLAWAGVHLEGRHGVLETREQALRELVTSIAADRPAEELAERARAAIRDELELTRRQQEELLAFAAAGDDDRPRILVLVAEGFDLDPFTFWSQHLPEESLRAVLADSAEVLAVASQVRKTGQALAAAGWTVLPLALTQVDASARDPAAVGAVDEQGNPLLTPGVSLDPRDIFRRRRERREAEAEPVKAELSAPLESLEMLAQPTGGEVSLSAAGLRDALDRFAGRLEVTYRRTVEHELGPRPLEVRARRAGLRVLAPRFTGHGTPPAMSAARLRQILARVPVDGGLDVAAALRVAEGEGRRSDLEARLNLRPIADELKSEARAAFAVSIAMARSDGETTFEHRLVDSQDLRGLDDWYFRDDLELPADATDVAVLIESLDKARWGGSLAAVIRADSGSEEEFLPEPRVVEVVRPDRELLRGRVRFEPRVHAPEVARVVFLLDDEQVADVDRRPFAARVDLGRSPRRQTLTLVAYDATGGELGRDSAVLNAGSGGLEVAIVQPGIRTGTGPIDFEAQVSVPLEQRLDRVLFFWNSAPIATLYRPPFRQRIEIPSDQPVGYVRVVAMLADGTVAEDVMFMNGPQASETLEVNLVELNVVVTDRDGRPVRGLGREDFVIREEGTTQTLATFSDASDLPLTLGMAIDSSSSMFVKLGNVQQAARRFLDSTFEESDRAFVVDFDSGPRLVRSTTGDLGRVLGAIDRLQADGRTALWESIVFSLVQLQGVRGRKALIVFSDGADEDEQFPFRSCMSFAKKMGVPIYLILMKERPPSTATSLWTRSFTSRADRLIEAVGGRVFYAKEYGNLDEVYEEIENELRSQYLLAYYPTGGRADAVWRDIDVEVTRKGLIPRTLRGYWP